MGCGRGWWARALPLEPTMASIGHEVSAQLDPQGGSTAHPVFP